MPHTADILKRFDEETHDLTDGYWIEKLADGTPMLIRQLADKDRAREFTFLKDLGEDMAHFRFLGSFSDQAEVHDQLMDIDSQNRNAYLALAFENDKLTEIGVARYGAFKGDVHCEFAVAVSKNWQRRGVATALLTRLMETATEKGFRKISSMDAARNEAMDELAKKMGFTCRVDEEHGPRVFHEYVLVM
ncbi:N-acetyltransferase family protein [Pseudomonas cannabina]|uniref:GNAT family acetyltransferase n=3 Tax=Pseudomonas syringae group TaxID=136849 RepID=A0A3M3QKQ7_PSECA|nr:MULTISPECIES: GNAT family N-acetyltransferase [Pseudomonas syringae group]KPB70442.1 GNAT family acetyltransferase [Pseudomonas syringae pv. maculicola]KPW17909.1 GNAT family acetyltransferase [Pseudomonas cannabina pv. alisalensis]MBM0142226.1 GNAT family N-acetyltransferase [Pseudomonas cannabina pv. alisalensis]QHE98500.1 GNAT family N-acetyltransferase [Pseudomonas syringae pv. maculicola str. ES4326]QQN23235.1 GNAT family N-acetyltransferase [Pseudomonas cannabina pv. alisalensis]